MTAMPSFPDPPRVPAGMTVTAIGDAQTIASHDLPIIRVNLGKDPDAGLAALGRALTAALKEA